MKFPWDKWEEGIAFSKKTLQVFITSRCNMKCKECFARKVIEQTDLDISISEYENVLTTFLQRGGHKINLLGGEPLLHPYLVTLLNLNRAANISTTIYTNGHFLNYYNKEDFKNTKLRVSLCNNGPKKIENLPKTDIKFDANFMVSHDTSLKDLLETASYAEQNYNCEVFFISSIRELDNPNQEFFDDTENTMPVLEYKELVHRFLDAYPGNMDVHISKRGVFESTKLLPITTCQFPNYFIGGKIIQCPYDIINLKFRRDYRFNKRLCQHNNTCLMSKVIYHKRRSYKPKHEKHD